MKNKLITAEYKDALIGNTNEGINECLKSPDKVRMKKNNKDNLLSIIEKVPHKGQIAGYSEALSKILQIQVY